ncbi:LysE family translocator [Streptomyces kunmingensis]|uniref:LysE family translocator n=1 Tax=Streptomyces kunmingensis TaxID=68225 RepID=A0ABU6CN04_9ACTN|nr:LysE family translocator [Streptomyces kunmingensis]MEB3965730.1 LysE family translocator [Streptomyces kunmingensis]
MLDLTLLPAYLAAVAIITITPGPDAAYITAVALERGPRAGLLSATGMALGMVVHVTAAALGLAVLLRSTPVALMLVEAVGGLYLAWLATTTIRSSRKTPTAHSGTPPGRQVLRRAVLTNLLNPKTVLFFAAFLPRFTSPEQGPRWLQLLTLGLIFLVVGLLWDSTIGLCAGRLGRQLLRGPRTAMTVNVVTGTTFAVLATFLLQDALTTAVA